MMWLLVENPDGTRVSFELRVLGDANIAWIKHGYRRDGARVVAVYRRKVREPVTYDSAGVED